MSCAIVNFWKCFFSGKWFCCLNLMESAINTILQSEHRTIEFHSSISLKLAVWRFLAQPIEWTERASWSDRSDGPMSLINLKSISSLDSENQRKEIHIEVRCLQKWIRKKKFFGELIVKFSEWAGQSLLTNAHFKDYETFVKEAAKTHNCVVESRHNNNYKI